MIVMKQKACRWNNHQRLVLHVIEPKWNIYKATIVLSNETYTVISSVQTLYQSLKIIPIRVGSHWGVNVRISSHYVNWLGPRRKIRYTTYQNVGISASLKFSSFVTQSLVRNTTFNVGASVSVLRNVYYDTNVKVVACRESEWRTFANPCAKSSNWNIRNIVHQQNVTGWNTSSICSTQRGATWKVHQVGIKASTTWQAGSPVSAVGVVVFNTRLTTTQDHGTMWNQYTSLWLRRQIKHKVLRSCVLAIPKGVQRIGEFRGAYLPSTTLAGLDKKQRLKLGIK